MAATEILLFASFIFISVYLWLKHNYSYWKRKGIPYVEPTPFLGNTTPMLRFKRNFGLTLSDIYNDERMKNEPVVGVYLLHKPSLIIRDMEILKSVLIKDFDQFSNRYSTCDPHNDVLGSLNLFFVKNPDWRQLRTKVSPVFTSGKIKQMYPLMQQVGNDLEQHLISKGNSFILNIQETCGYFTTDMIALIAFGVNVESLKNPDAEFRVHASNFFKFNVTRALDFFVIFFLPHLAKLTRRRLFPEDFTKFLSGTMDYVISEREKSGVIRNDLIDIMLALEKEEKFEGSKFNDYITAQAAAFVVAGYETSSATITFALYELAKRPELQQRLREEINAAVVEGDGTVSYEKIHSMEYLGMVADETLRMYPSLPFLDRVSEIDDKKGYSLKPYFDFNLPDGMPIFIPIFGIQRDAEYWPNPNTFDPERFSAENKKLQNSMAYMPFGSGQRMCIGNRIGMLNTKIGLISFLKNHYVTTCDRTVKEMEFDPKAIVLQCKGGVYLNVIYDGLYEKTKKL